MTQNPSILKKYHILILIIAVSLVLTQIILTSCSRKKEYKVQKLKNNTKVIVGTLTWEQWEDASGWNFSTAEGNPQARAVAEEIGSIVNSNDISFILFTASWCPDSERAMPRIYSLFRMADIEPAKTEIIGLDIRKKEPSMIIKAYRIRRVPTLIVLLKHKEIGRIVETPGKSWEDDLLSIFLKNGL